MRGGEWAVASRGFSLVELMAVMSTGLILMAASTRLWSGLGTAQAASPRQAALTLGAALDEAMQLSRGLGTPVAVACAEAKSDGGAPESQLILLRALQTADPEIAVAWPVRLGSEQHWQQEGEARHLAGVTVQRGGGSFSRGNLQWRVLSIATPSGEWATAPSTIDSWANLESDSTLQIIPAKPTPDLQSANLILHAACARPTIEVGR